jgi:hypothetical protein
MIESAKEFMDLVECGDEASWQRLRFDTATAEVWEEILSRYPDRKRTVARNKKLDDAILRRLANDPDSLVRLDVAMKRRLPADVFALLAQDSDESVRAEIASNKKTPDEVRRLLLSDPWDFVAERARERLGL